MIMDLLQGMFGVLCGVGIGWVIWGWDDTQGSDKNG